MVTKPDRADLPALKQIWSDIFKDRQDYIDLFFSRKFRPEDTLIYRHNGEIASMVFYPPYSLKIGCRIFSAGYICGAATLPAYRGRGIMGELLESSFGAMAGRGDTFSVLIPASASLYEYYARFGYLKKFYLKKEYIKRNSSAGVAANIRLKPAADKDIILSIYDEAVKNIDLLVLQKADTIDAVIADHRLAGGEILTTYDDDTYIFVLRIGKTLAVKEAFSTSVAMPDILSALFFAYQDIETIHITGPVHDDVISAPDVMPAGMIKPLDESLAHLLADKSAGYMNLMLD